MGCNISSEARFPRSIAQAPIAKTLLEEGCVQGSGVEGKIGGGAACQGGAAGQPAALKLSDCGESVYTTPQRRLRQSRTIDIDEGIEEKAAKQCSEKLKADAERLTHQRVALALVEGALAGIEKMEAATSCEAATLVTGDHQLPSDDWEPDSETCAARNKPASGSAAGAGRHASYFSATASGSAAAYAAAAGRIDAAAESQPIADLNLELGAAADGTASCGAGGIANDVLNCGRGPSGNCVYIKIGQVPKSWGVDVRTYKAYDTWQVIPYQKEWVTDEQWICAGQQPGEEFCISLYDDKNACLVGGLMCKAGDCLLVNYHSVKVTYKKTTFRRWKGPWCVGHYREGKILCDRRSQ